MPLNLAAAIIPRFDITLRPYDGWALKYAVEIDRYVPSFLAKTYRWGALRRQVLYLILSTLDGNDDPSDLARRFQFRHQGTQDTDPWFCIGRALLTLRPSEILRVVFGEIPPGMVGTLRRVGSDPFVRPESYRTLVRVFSSSEGGDRHRVRLLARTSGLLTEDQIEALSILDPLLLHPAVIARMRRVTDAVNLNHAVEFVKLRCSKAPDQALRQSLDDSKAKVSVSQWLRRWVNRCDRLPVNRPLNNDPTLIVLDSADAIIDAGRRFKNCLATRVGHVMTGRSLYVEYRPINPNEIAAIVELRYTSNGYLLEGVHGRSNSHVSDKQAVGLRARLARGGIAIRSHAPGNEAQLAAAAKLLSIYDWSSGNEWSWDDIEGDAEV